MSRKKVVAVAALVLGSAAIAVPASSFPNQTLNPDVGPAGSTLIGIHYADGGGNGEWIRWIGGSSCTASTTNIDYSEASFSQEEANDELSSFEDYNLCDTAWYINASYGGARYPSSGYVNASSTPDNLPTSYLGTRFYDEVSSARWS